METVEPPREVRDFLGEESTTQKRPDKKRRREVEKEGSLEVKDVKRGITENRKGRRGEESFLVLLTRTLEILV